MDAIVYAYVYCRYGRGGYVLWTRGNEESLRSHWSPAWDGRLSLPLA